MVFTIKMLKTPNKQNIASYFVKFNTKLVPNNLEKIPALFNVCHGTE